MKKFALLLAVALLAMPAFADGPVVVHNPAPNHLEPVDWDIGNYHGVVDDVFKEAFGPEIRLRATVEPSFQREYVVALSEQSGVYRLVLFEAREQVWLYILMKGQEERAASATNPEDRKDAEEEVKKLRRYVPADMKDIRASRLEVDVKPVLAAKLIEVWTGMLRNVRKAENPVMGLDGEFYRYSMVLDGKPVEGITWSPPSDTNPGLLVELTLAIRDYCHSKRSAQLAKIETLSDTLLTKLHQVPPK